MYQTVTFISDAVGRLNLNLLKYIKISKSLLFGSFIFNCKRLVVVNVIIVQFVAVFRLKAAVRLFTFLNSFH